MRVALVQAGLPLSEGAERRALDGLAAALGRLGHGVEPLPLPAIPDLAERPAQMAAIRQIELARHFDAVVAIGVPAHALRHPRKLCWLPALPGEVAPEGEAAAQGLRAALDRADARAFGEAAGLFAGEAAAAAVLRRLGLSAVMLPLPLDRAGWDEATRRMLAESAA